MSPQWAATMLGCHCHPRMDPSPILAEGGLALLGAHRALLGAGVILYLVFSVTQEFRTLAWGWLSAVRVQKHKLLTCAERFPRVMVLTLRTREELALLPPPLGRAEV